jgi:hypothetical protein
MKHLKRYKIFENSDDQDLEEVRRAFVEDVGDDFDIEEVDSIDYIDWEQKNRFFIIKRTSQDQKIILNALMPSEYINDDSLEKSLLNFKKRLENLGYSSTIRAPFPAFNKRVTKRFTCHIQFLIERV